MEPVGYPDMAQLKDSRRKKITSSPLPPKVGNRKVLVRGTISVENPSFFSTF